MIGNITHFKTYNNRIIILFIHRYVDKCSRTYFCTSSYKGLDEIFLTSFTGISDHENNNHDNNIRGDKYMKIQGMI